MIEIPLLVLLAGSFASQITPAAPCHYASPCRLSSPS